MGAHLQGYGCSGVNAVSYGLINHELEYGDSGLRSAVSVQGSLAMFAIHRWGSDEQKERWLPGMAKGELIGCFGLSEADAGSDPGSMRTFARRDGDDWVINGRKMWITSGTQSDWICMLVRTSDEGGYHGMSMIIVPTSTPGFSVGRKLKKMGNNSSDTAELVLDDVRVPVRYTIGEAGRGFQMQMAQFQDERLWICYMAVTGARRAIDRTIEYLQMREAFGKPLLANQYIQYQLAELVADIDVLHGFLHHTAERYVAGEDVTRAATVAKLQAGRLSRRVADACVQFHGGMGYAEEMWVARYFRDCRLGSIGGGADEVMLRIISMLEGMGRK
jgi:citronellyl-CoA dehydrogenase